MSAEQIGIPEEGNEQDAQLHLSFLMKELVAFANNNPRFRKGQSDYVALKVIEAERDDESTRDKFEEDDGWSLINGEDDEDDEQDESDDEDKVVVPVAEFTYTFEAQRRRLIGENGKQDAQVEFVFSVLGINHNVLLPGHVAEAELGLPSEEAAREFGGVSYRAERVFRLNTKNRSLAVCENYTYVDLDGDAISGACSCNSGELIYVSNETEMDNADDDLATLSDSAIQQYAPAVILERSVNEQIEYADVEAAQEQWKAMQELGTDIDASLRQDHALNARVVLRNIQDAVWLQAGLTPDEIDQKRKQMKKPALQIVQ